MTSGSDLRKIVKARLKTVDILMKASDWEGAVYMMGYVLECALKAASCRSLNLTQYPDTSSSYSERVAKFFKTHEFDALLIISGLQDLFGFNGSAYQNWSEFTQEYPGNWPEMRYITGRVWDAAKVTRLYNNLIEHNKGLISIIKRKRRW